MKDITYYQQKIIELNFRLEKLRNKTYSGRGRKPFDTRISRYEHFQNRLNEKIQKIETRISRYQQIVAFLQNNPRKTRKTYRPASTVKSQQDFNRLIEKNLSVLRMHQMNVSIKDLPDLSNNYAPLTPEIIIFKFACIIQRQILSICSRYNAEQSELFMQAVSYLADKSDEYNPNMGAQSTFVLNKLRGFSTIMSREYQRDANSISLDAGFDEEDEEEESGLFEIISDANSLDAEIGECEEAKQEFVQKLLKMCAKESIADPETILYDFEHLEKSKKSRIKQIAYELLNPVAQ